MDGRPDRDGPRELEPLRRDADWEQASRAFQRLPALIRSTLDYRSWAAGYIARMADEHDLPDREQLAQALMGTELLAAKGLTWDDVAEEAKETYRGLADAVLTVLARQPRRTDPRKDSEVTMDGRLNPGDLPGEPTTADWVLDPDAWCGWPLIHGPHERDGRLCSGVLWRTEGDSMEKWAKAQAIEAAMKKEEQ